MSVTAFSTFSRVDFNFSDVNSSLSTLLSSPVSSLTQEIKPWVGHSHYSPVEGLVVFKVLAQSLQEESELPELDEVRTVFTGSFGHIFYVVETSVDGGDGIKQLIHCDDVTDSLKCVINIYYN